MRGAPALPMRLAGTLGVDLGRTIYGIICRMGNGTDPTRERFLRAFAAEGAVVGLVWGGGIVAAASLALRALVHPAPAWIPSLLAALPVAAAAGSLINHRRAPSRAACAAMTEDATHAGGLLLVDGVPGAEAWPRPSPVAAEVPGRALRHLPKAIPVLAALAFAFAAPAEWFAAAAPTPTRTFPDVTSDLRNAIEDVREEELLAPETVEELSEELKRIEASADPSDPGAALDSADRLRERLATLLELNDANLKRVAKNPDALAAIASDPAAAEELKKMLEESCSGSCPYGEERPGEGEGQGEGRGEGEGIGSGDPQRGRGDAPMAWGDQSRMDGSEYKDRAAEPKPGAGGDEEKTGESISKEDPTAKSLAPRRAGGPAPGGRSTGRTLNRTVSPRHRGTVKRFFDTERKNP